MKLFFLNLNNFSELTLHNFKFYLNDSELARYNRGKSTQYLLSKALLKYVIASELSTSHEDLVVRKDHGRRPYIADEEIVYNISHSRDMIALIVSSHNVSIDIELMKHRDYIKVAEYYFDDKTVAEIKGAVDIKLAFYTAWTNNEAIVKYYSGSIFDSKRYALEGLYRCDAIVSDVKLVDDKIDVNQQVKNSELGEYSLSICSEVALQKGFELYNVYPYIKNKEQGCAEDSVNNEKASNVNANNENANNENSNNVNVESLKSDEVHERINDYSGKSCFQIVRVADEVKKKWHFY